MQHLHEIEMEGGENTFTGLNRNATNLTVLNSATPAELFCVPSIKAVLHYLYLMIHSVFQSRCFKKEEQKEETEAS